MIVNNFLVAILSNLLACTCQRADILSTPPNITLSNSLGINCRGSWLCSNQDLEADYVQVIYDVAAGFAKCTPGSHFDCGPMNDTDIYKPSSYIVCLPQGKAFLGGICAFTQGNVSVLGITGEVIKRKLLQLINHGCRV